MLELYRQLFQNDLQLKTPWAYFEILELYELTFYKTIHLYIYIEQTVLNSNYKTQANYKALYKTQQNIKFQTPLFFWNFIGTLCDFWNLCPISGTLCFERHAARSNWYHKLVCRLTH